MIDETSFDVESMFFVLSTSTTNNDDNDLSIDDIRYLLDDEDI